MVFVATSGGVPKEKETKKMSKSFGQKVERNKLISHGHTYELQPYTMGFFGSTNGHFWGLSMSKYSNYWVNFR